METLATYGAPIDSVNIFELLTETIARTAGHVRWLAERIASEQPEALIWGEKRTTARQGKGAEYAEVSSEARPSVWLTLYRAERRDLMVYLKTAHECGIQEREIELAERQGALMAEVLRRVFGDPELALSNEQQEKAAQIASRHLRVLPAA